MNEEALVQFVPDIDSNVVVCGYIDSRTWKLAVDSNDLQKQCNADIRAITKNTVALHLTKSTAYSDILHHITIYKCPMMQICK